MRPHIEKVELELQSGKDSLNVVGDRLAEALEKLGIGDDVLFDLKLALQEAVVNAVEHGNECDERKLVRVRCETDGDTVTLVVCDEGAGFDPALVPDPTLPENILREHGRGIFLMRNLCDELRFNPKGNEITMIKRIRHR